MNEFKDCQAANREAARTIPRGATASPVVTPEERAELQEVIQDYRRSLVPLVVPLTLIRHYVRKCRVTYLEDQAYLQPHPKELMLRNHV